MPAKKAGEIEKIRKKQRKEHIIMYSVALFLCAFFIMLSFIFGGFKEYGKIEPEVTPGPTPDPRMEVLSRLVDMLGGGITESEDGYLLTYTSKVDSTAPVVKVYLSSNIPSITSTRKLKDPEAEPTSMFVEDDPKDEPVDQAELIRAIADETAACLGCLNNSEGASAALRAVSNEIVYVIEGSKDKGTAIFGVYIVSVSYDDSNRILTVKCEPA